eukprot:819280-Pyramimonas_sp.AAC.1
MVATSPTRRSFSHSVSRRGGTPNEALQKPERISQTYSIFSFNIQIHTICSSNIPQHTVLGYKACRGMKKQCGMWDKESVSDIKWTTSSADRLRRAARGAAVQSMPRKDRNNEERT